MGDRTALAVHVPVSGGAKSGELSTQEIESSRPLGRIRYAGRRRNAHESGEPSRQSTWGGARRRSQRVSVHGVPEAAARSDDDVVKDLHPAKWPCAKLSTRRWGAAGDRLSGMFSGVSRRAGCLTDVDQGVPAEVGGPGRGHDRHSGAAAGCRRPGW